MYRDAMNVENEMCDHTNNNWSHSNSNKILKENLEAIPGNTEKTAVLGTSCIMQEVLQSET